MAIISSVGTSVPRHRFSQSEAKQFISQYTNESLQKYLAVFDQAAIDTRYFAADREWLHSENKLSDRHQLWFEEGLNLAQEAVENCLGNYDQSLEIDAIISVTSTGILTPSFDAHLINELQLSSSIKRMPMFGLGCAGGAIGLARAFDYLKAHPDESLLLVCCELASTAFHPRDLTKKDIVGAAIFSDGAAAVLLLGANHDLVKQSEGCTVQINTTDSKLLPDSLDVMGWDVKDDGFHVVFSQKIPRLVNSFWAPQVQEFLERNNLTQNYLNFVVAHPGGKKIIEQLEDIIPDSLKLDTAKSVLRQFGNMSSPTVLFVLQSYINQELKQGDKGLLTALGPGFSSEILLLEVI
ncbi:type III polyketide synthase [Alkalibacillus almallahensis]|uniref:type III polyketide synthase n=1 Tax=Alkalibacillus almallahensis TaxID=1379154 RepID=UPI00141E6FCA|nr:3-oxoacyl-[acyl-carrier-protein] synthase III C-terminal domain-containing protein [Alkalibacillus almallahensis]NIK11025.1 alkylresorcinol/alkylpyrone synthase [Alkalibacillus almallahensis]